MGDEGWRALDVAKAQVDTGRVLLLSSVHALGPAFHGSTRYGTCSPTCTNTAIGFPCGIRTTAPAVRPVRRRRGLAVT